MVKLSGAFYLQFYNYRSQLFYFIVFYLSTTFVLFTKIEIQRIITFFGDVRECETEELTRLAAKQTPLKLIFKSNLLSASDCHAVAYVLRRVSKRLEMLKLSSCNLDDHSFSYICSAIKEMPGNVSKFL